MIQQEDSEERRGISSALFQVLCGFQTLDSVRDDLRPYGLGCRQMTLPDGGERFVFFWLKSGQIHDHFDFYFDGSSRDEEPEDSELHGHN